MKNFIFGIFQFLFFAFLLAEVIIRLSSATPEYPERTIVNGVQKYVPGQSGYYSSVSTEKWLINKYGWPGIADVDHDTIISIIGDSYIENLMNPQECNQASYLHKIEPKYGYFEAARSGMTLIEELELLDEIDSLIKPNLNLIYISDDDVYESIYEIRAHSDITQISLQKNMIIPGRIKYPVLKKLLYGIKTLHFIYLRKGNFLAKEVKDVIPQNSFDERKEKVTLFMEYVSENYNCDKVIFVFRPHSSNDLIAIFERQNLQTIKLHSKDYSKWQFVNDSHWNCFGHAEAASQVFNQLRLRADVYRKSRSK